ncbi:MRN complex-interacting protein [Lucilia cuprina]|nr:MRN complex-interacting protein [Lucilia cuprina]
MPQEVHVLQCFSCKIFQVDIVKKTSKWQCRVCNLKQTVRKEYFRGTAKECRCKVQELNMAKGQKYNESVNSILDVLKAATDCSSLNNKDVLDGSNNNEAYDQNQKLSTKGNPHKTVDDFSFRQTKKYCRGSGIENIFKAEKQKHNEAFNRTLEVPKSGNRK